MLPSRPLPVLSSSRGMSRITSRGDSSSFLYSTPSRLPGQVLVKHKTTSTKPWLRGELGSHLQLLLQHNPRLRLRGPLWDLAPPAIHQPLSAPNRVSRPLLLPRLGSFRGRLSHKEALPLLDEDQLVARPVPPLPRHLDPDQPSLPVPRSFLSWQMPTAVLARLYHQTSPQSMLRKQPHGWPSTHAGEPTRNALMSAISEGHLLSQTLSPQPAQSGLRFLLVLLTSQVLPLSPSTRTSPRLSASANFSPPRKPVTRWLTWCNAFLSKTLFHAQSGRTSSSIGLSPSINSTQL